MTFVSPQSGCQENLAERQAVPFEYEFEGLEDRDSLASLFEDDSLFGESLGHLTPTQRAVLDMIARGYMNKQIAWVRGISEATVKAHLSEILRRLDLRSRTQAAVRYALYVDRRRKRRLD